MKRHRMVHEKFSKLGAKMSMQEPPCMSNAEDWESQNGWVDELAPAPVELSSMPSLPDGSSEWASSIICSHRVISGELPSGAGRKTLYLHFFLWIHVFWDRVTHRLRRLLDIASPPCERSALPPQLQGKRTFICGKLSLHSEPGKSICDR